MASDLSAMINGCSDIITELHKVQHSPKLVALQEILEECGIGSDASSSDGTLSVGQHRVLIFAQHKVFTSLISSIFLLGLFPYKIVQDLTMLYYAGFAGYH